MFGCWNAPDDVRRGGGWCDAEAGEFSTAITALVRQCSNSYCGSGHGNYHHVP